MLSTIYSIIQRFFTLHHGTKLYWVPVILACGIGAYFSSSYNISFITLLIPLAISMLLIIGMKNHYALLSLFFLIIWTFVCGYSLAQLQNELSATVTIKSNDRVVWIRATLENIEKRIHGHRILIKDIDLWTPETRNFSPSEVPTKARVEVRTSINPTLRPGDRVAFKAKLYPPPSSPAFPDGYDFSRYAYFHKIGAVGFAISDVKPFTKKGQNYSYNPINTMRYSLIEHINQLLLEMNISKNSRTILSALLFSERGHIPKDTLDTIRFAGIGHLLAISGLHMALVMAGCYFIMRTLFALFPAIALPFSSKKPSACIALVMGIVYLALTGAPVSATRAYIMAAIFFVAILIDRQSFSLRPVAIAAILILVIDPYALLTPSFQMSFAAVTALITFFSRYPLHIKSANNFTHYFRNIFLYILAMTCSSVVAGVATLPFSLYHFGYTSTYSILANLIAIPLTSFIIMPFAFLGLVSSIADISTYFFYIASYAIDIMINYVTYLTTPHNGAMYFSKIPSSYIILYSLSMCGMFLLKTPYKNWMIVPTIISLICILNPPSPPDILISEEGNLYAFRVHDDALVFSSYQKERYVRSEWIKATGHPTSYHLRDREKYFSNSIQVKDDNVIFDKNNQKTIILQKYSPLNICNDYALIINLSKTNIYCDNDVKIIRVNSLAKNGTHVIWLYDTPKIQTVTELKTRYYRQTP